MMRYRINIISFFAILVIANACNSSTKQPVNKKNNVETLNIDNEMYRYINQYFILSENREIEQWYNVYLTKCKQFYKIENPTKDSIIGLIKSYWITSNNQKHDILNIEQLKSIGNTNYIVTMNYSYNIIVSNTKRMINNLKLLIILDKKNKIILIKEISRG